jgi:GlpG protein
VVQALSISRYGFVLEWIDSPTGHLGESVGDFVWKFESPGLEPILHGEVWRLVTPIFIHIGIWHLVFNMYCLYSMGGAIERQRGRLRYVSLILFLAILSNLCQYFLGRPDLGVSIPLPDHVPAFGGMSGVIYGLFGYIWIKARFQPELGLSISPRTITILMIWFFLCMTPWMRLLIGTGVANVAHASGLIAGMLVGYAPVLWQSLRSD